MPHDSAPKKLDTPVVPDEVLAPVGEDTDAASAEPPADDGLARFLDRRRPVLRPITARDHRRRRGGLYWAFVYVLLLAGFSSVVSFLGVQGYLLLWPGPTNSGAEVAAKVVPWVATVFYIAFAWWVTRNVRRTILYALLFLSPLIVVLFVNELTSIANWVVGWLPGGLRVYGLVAFVPLIAVYLLGRDFVRWQLWVEFPEDTCWTCGATVTDETWMVCPFCGNDLQTQRHEASLLDDRPVESAGSAVVAAKVEAAASTSAPNETVDEEQIAEDDDAIAAANRDDGDGGFGGRAGPSTDEPRHVKPAAPRVLEGSDEDDVAGEAPPARTKRR